MALKQEERAGEEGGLPEPEDQKDPDEPAFCGPTTDLPFALKIKGTVNP